MSRLLSLNARSLSRKKLILKFRVLGYSGAFSGKRHPFMKLGNKKSLMQKIREIIAEILDDDLETTDTETTVELNFALLKFK